MTPYIVAPTGDTPAIELNASKGIFLIKGKSLPEDAHEFYDPLIKWMKIYRNTPNPETKMVCKLEYFNTASSKKILDFLNEFVGISGKVSIEWHYLEDDDDMKDIGKEFSGIIDLPFTLIMDHAF